MTARQIDPNGFIRIYDNPIAKEGIKRYLGREIRAPDPNKIYNVYIPAEELSNPDFIDGLKNLPIIDGHIFIGDTDPDAVPAEKKGIQGTLGEQIYFDAPYLKANINIYSSSMKNTLDPDNPDGYNDLSLGYKSWYEFSEGYFDGVKYDAIQRLKTPNHMAVVEEGRSGSDIAIFDHNTLKTEIILTYDSAENLFMAQEDEKEVVKARLTEALDKLKDMDESERDELLKAVGLKTYTDVKSADEGGEDEPPKKTEDEGSEGDEPPKKTEDEAGDEPPQKTEDDNEDAGEAQATMDAANERIKALENKIKSLESINTADAAIKEIAGRDALVSKVTPYIGTFDHATMTRSGVASYAVKKLGLKVEAGTEEIAINAYLHNRVPEHKQSTIKAMDSASTSKNVAAQFDQFKEE